MGTQQARRSAITLAAWFILGLGVTPWIAMFMFYVGEPAVRWLFARPIHLFYATTPLTALILFIALQDWLRERRSTDS